MRQCRDAEQSLRAWEGRDVLAYAGRGNEGSAVYIPMHLSVAHRGFLLVSPDLSQPSWLLCLGCTREGQFFGKTRSSRLYSRLKLSRLWRLILASSLSSQLTFCANKFIYPYHLIGDYFARPLDRYELTCSPSECCPSLRASLQRDQPRCSGLICSCQRCLSDHTFR